MYLERRFSVYNYIKTFIFNILHWIKGCYLCTVSPFDKLEQVVYNLASYAQGSFSAKLYLGCGQTKSAVFNRVHCITFCVKSTKKPLIDRSTKGFWLKN